MGGGWWSGYSGYFGDARWAHHTQVAIRKPPVGPHKLPVTLPGVFRAGEAEFRDDGEQELASLLPWLHCFAISRITLLMEAPADGGHAPPVLVEARMARLREWFRDHDVDTGHVEWASGAGAQQDQVQIHFAR